MKKRMSVVIGALCAIAIAFLLSGCDDGAKQQSPPAVPPKSPAAGKAVAQPAQAGSAAQQVAPEKLMQGIEYGGAGKRDPFVSLAARTEGQKKSGPASLENFDPGELQLIAVLWDKATRYAVLTTPDGKSFTVREGAKAGLHGGQVAKILQDSVVIREMVKNYKGVLAPKDTVLKLRRGDEQ